MYKSRMSTMLAMVAMAVYMTPTDGEANQNAGAAPEATQDNTPAETPEAKAAREAAEAEAKAVKHREIKAKFNNLVDIKETDFYFRTVTDPETKIKTKRATVQIPVPVPSIEGIIAFLEAGDEKQITLLLEAVQDKVLEQVREWVNENETANADNAPYDKFSWEFIANMPKAERRGGGIPKEMWEEFEEEYKAIMPGLTGKTKEQTELAAKLFTTKFANAKTNKPVLKLLKDQFTVFISNSQKLDSFAQVVEWIDKKLDTLINTDETNLLKSL